MHDGDRRFAMAFAIGVLLVVAPLLGLATRLVQLGEIALDIGPTRGATLNGTLFADGPVFKLKQSLERTPDVLVLGSSRVSEFRAEMFAGCRGRADCFYNATGALPNLRTGVEFVRLLGAARAPRLLLLGIDLWDVDPNYEQVRGRVVEPLRRDLRGQLDRAFAVTRSAAALALTDPAMRDVLVGRTPVPDDAAGLAAILHQTGYRQDGSLAYAEGAWRSALERTDAVRSADYLRLVRIGGLEFEPFERADDAALNDVRDLLDLATASGTRVVAFMPPFSDAVAAVMRAQPHYAEGVEDARNRLAALFAEREVPFVGSLSMSEYGCADDEHIDGVHASEVCGARILLALAAAGASGRAMAGYVDAAELARLVAQRRSSFSLDLR